MIVDNSLALTGAFKSIAEVTSKIDSAKFYFAIPSKSAMILDLRKREMDVISLNFIEISRSVSAILYFPFLIWNSIRLLRYIKKNCIEIVHVNDMYNMCGVAVKLIRPKTKVVYHVRLMPDSYIRSLYHFFVYLIRKYSDRVISVSEAVKSKLEKLGLASILIYDSIKISEKHDVKNFTQGVKLLYLANFTKGKGHEYAIRAFSIAKRQVPNLHLVIAGGDLGLGRNKLYKRDLQREVVRLGLTNCIVFRGFIDDTERIIKEADIFLNFSESESFSITCLEAVTYGVPLIVTDCGGPSEIFENEVSGLLVPNKGVEEMAAAIVRLSQNKNLREDFSREGKRYVAAKFGQLKSAEALSSVYISL